MKPDNFHTIFLLEDHELVGKGLLEIFNKLPEVSVAQWFKSGNEILNALVLSAPDVVFLDIMMANNDGISTLQKIKEKHPQLPCVMLSMLDERSVILECIQKGANGYMHKDSRPEELSEALRTVLNGKVYFSLETQKIIDGERQRLAYEQLNIQDPLTERELDVLRLLCDGYTSKEIADKLFLSPRTIDTHKTNLMHKMGVNTTGKLIALSIRYGVV